MIFGVSKSSPFHALIAVYYVIMLSLYLMVTTALFTVRMEPAWQSAGGRTVVVLILLMVVPCTLATTGVLQGQAAVIVYPITLLLAVAISLVVLVRSARSKNASFESVKPAKWTDLDRWSGQYCRELLARLKRIEATMVDGRPNSSLLLTKLEARKKLLVRKLFAQAVHVRRGREEAGSNDRSCCCFVNQKKKRQTAAEQQEEELGHHISEAAVGSALVVDRADILPKENLLMQW